MKITTIGYSKYLKGIKKDHLMFRQGKLLEKLASKTWEISPGNSSISPKAFYLNDQLERITGTEFANPISTILGGTINHAPTRAFRIKDVFMINGSIYKNLQRLIYHEDSIYGAKTNFFPPLLMETEIDEASIYNSFYGNKYFYNWLVDDCPMYQLAATEGVPVTFDVKSYSHAPEYESALEMNPIKVNSAYLKNAIFFDDEWGNSHSKQEKFNLIRNKLRLKYANEQHAGVFILRRASGITRILQNEIELAERLRDKYGFRIVDVTTHSASEILSACVGAKILVGIEGSQLTHGLMVLQPGASVIMLQPPYRFVGVMKLTADMANVNYAFVVGNQTEQGFCIDFEELERTIELLPSI